MNDYAAMGIGIVCAGIGGELFVRGIVGIARWARVSAGIVAASVAAFATSSPELSIAVSSAMAKKPEISLGDALGSNVVNVALIFAIPLLMSGMKSSPENVRRDFPFALFAPILTGALALDGELSRWDGALLLAAFAIWLAYVIMDARKQRSAAGKVLGEPRGWLAFVLSGAGLLFLVAAGAFIVMGARGIARAFGVHEFIIGATVVAIGTSVPELATTLMSKYRGHDEVGLGTILGSNIFNGLFIVAVAAIICPIKAALREVALVLLFGVITVVLIWPVRGGHIGRRRGLLLLGLYVAYIILVVEQ